MGTDLITTTKLLCRFRYEELCFRPMARDNTLEKPEETDGSGEKKNARPQRELSDAALFYRSLHMRRKKTLPWSGTSNRAKQSMQLSKL